MSNELHRDLGRVEGKLDAMSADVAAMKSKLDSVLASDHKRRGALLVVASAWSAVVAFATAWYTK